MQMFEHLNHYDFQVIIESKEVKDARKKYQKVTLVSIRGQVTFATPVPVFPWKHQIFPFLGKQEDGRTAPFLLFRWCCNQMNVEYLKRRNGQNRMSRLQERLGFKSWFDKAVDARALLAQF